MGTRLRITCLVLFYLSVLLSSTLMHPSDGDVHNKRSKRWLKDLCGSFYPFMNRSTTTSNTLFVSVEIGYQCQNVPLNIYPVKFKVYLRELGDTEKRLRTLSSCDCHRKRSCSRYYQNELSERSTYVVTIQIQCSGNICDQCAALTQTIFPYRTTTITSSSKTNIVSSGVMKKSEPPSYITLIACLVGALFIGIITTAVFCKIVGCRDRHRFEGTEQEALELNTNSEHIAPRVTMHIAPRVTYCPGETLATRRVTKRILYVELPSKERLLYKILNEFKTLNVEHINQCNHVISQNIIDWICKVTEFYDGVLIVASKELCSLVQENDLDLHASNIHPMGRIIVKLLQHIDDMVRNGGDCVIERYVVTFHKKTQHLTEFRSKYRSLDTGVVFDMSSLNNGQNLSTNGPLKSFLFSLLGHVPHKSNIIDRTLTEIDNKNTCVEHGSETDRNHLEAMHSDSNHSNEDPHTENAYVEHRSKTDRNHLHAIHCDSNHSNEDSTYVEHRGKTDSNHLDTIHCDINHSNENSYTENTYVEHRSETGRSHLQAIHCDINHSNEDSHTENTYIEHRIETDRKHLQAIHCDINHSNENSYTENTYAEHSSKTDSNQLRVIHCDIHNFDDDSYAESSV